MELEINTIINIGIESLAISLMISAVGMLVLILILTAINMFFDIEKVLKVINTNLKKCVLVLTMVFTVFILINSIQEEKDKRMLEMKKELIKPNKKLLITDK